MTGRGIRLLSGTGLTVILACLGAAPAGAGIPTKTIAGITYVGISHNVAPGYHSRSVKCPGNKHVVGGGFQTAGSYDTMRLQSSFPIDDGDAGSKPDDGWKATWSAFGEEQTSVQAICIKQPVRYVSHPFKVPAGAEVAGVVSCPDDTSAASGGLRASRHVVMNSSFPEEVDSATEWADNLGAKKKSPEAFVTCVKFPVSTANASNNVAPSTQGLASVFCPGGTYVIGGGVKSAGFWAETVINTTVFAPDNPAARWGAFADNHAAVARALTSYVVCSEPLN